jgi:hypothetical protein
VATRARIGARLCVSSTVLGERGHSCPPVRRSASASGQVPAQPVEFVFLAPQTGLRKVGVVSDAFNRTTAPFPNFAIDAAILPQQNCSRMLKHEHGQDQLSLTRVAYQMPGGASKKQIQSAIKGLATVLAGRGSHENC